MDDLPGVVFGSEDARNPKGNWSELLPSADLGLEALDLHEVRKLRSFILGYLLEARELTVSVIGCGPLQSLLNRGPSTRDRAKGVSESHILPLGEHRLVDVRVPVYERAERSVVLLEQFFV
jgi:hypothetical protein